MIILWQLFFFFDNLSCRRGAKRLSGGTWALEDRVKSDKNLGWNRKNFHRWFKVDSADELAKWKALAEELLKWLNIFDSQLNTKFAKYFNCRGINTKKFHLVISIWIPKFPRNTASSFFIASWRLLGKNCERQHFVYKTILSNKIGMKQLSTLKVHKYFDLSDNIKEKNNWRIKEQIKNSLVEFSYENLKNF